MNIIKKSILWVKQKIQTMLNKLRYDTNKYNAIQALTHHYLFLADHTHHTQNQDIMNMFTYLNRKNVDFDKDKMKIKFSIGDYNFFVQANVYTTLVETSAKLSTYEIIEHYDRRKDNGDILIEKVENLDIRIDKSGSAYMSTAQNNYFEQYCLLLIKHIEEVENGITSKNKNIRAYSG